MTSRARGASLLLMRSVAWAAILVLVACRAPASSPPSAADPTEPAPAAETPDDVFGPWDGVWKGTFEVWDGDQVLTRLEVEQRYWSDSDTRQEGAFVEQDLESKETVTARAINSKDGDALRCEVEKSTGEKVVHQGRWTGDAIEWFRKTAELEEHFFEKVYTDADGRTWYRIDGWGRYGQGPKLTFVGSYQRIGSEEDARAKRAD